MLHEVPFFMPPAGEPIDMRVPIARGLSLATPVAAASGAFGYGEEVADLADIRLLGALFTPTITLAARSGSPMPRTAETSCGLLHSLGWPNPGLEQFLADRLPALLRLPCPCIVSIHGENAQEWSALAAGLNSAGVAGAELNLSRISLAGEAEILRGIGDAVRAARCVAAMPLIAKLPAANVEIGAAAAAAVEAGADAVSVSQGFPGVAVKLSSRAFRLPEAAGDLSGPCIKPLALYQVWRVAQSVSVPIIASGGIMTGEDALEFLIAGASAVAVGIASAIHPGVIARIAQELHEAAEREGPDGLGGLVGAALRSRSPGR